MIRLLTSQHQIKQIASQVAAEKSSMYDSFCWHIIYATKPFSSKQITSRYISHLFNAFNVIKQFLYFKFRRNLERIFDCSYNFARFIETVNNFQKKQDPNSEKNRLKYFRKSLICTLRYDLSLKALKHYIDQ